MAQAPQQPGGDGAAHFVRQIVTDPKNVPDVMLLRGYLGASSEEAHERLYLSPDLANYVEVPKSAILHQAPVPNEQDPHGGVTLWVKKDAALQYKMAPGAQALANYFAGAIQAGARGAAAPPLPTPPLTIPPAACGGTLPNVCRVTAACTFNTCGIDCTAFGPGCQSFHATCGIDCTVVVCPTRHLTCAPCLLTQRTPCPGVSCGIDCTVVFCPTNQATCAPCTLTQRTPCPGVSCGIDCTVVGPACQSIRVGTCFLQCNPTRFQPECPFPTEVTCVPVCAASLAPACGPNVTIGGCSAGCFPGQPGQFRAAAPPVPPQSLGCGQPTLADAGCSVGGACTFDGCGQTLADPGCSFAACTFDGCGQPTLADPGCSFFDQCGSQFGSCDPICFPTAVCPTANCPTANCTFGCPPSVFGTCLPAATCAANCTQICTVHVTCNPGCRPTNPAVCQIASAACAVASPACPQPSLACGGFPGQPGFGRQAAEPPTNLACGGFRGQPGFGRQAAQPPTNWWWCHSTQAPPCWL